MYEGIGADASLFLSLNNPLGTLMDNFMWLASSKLTIIPLGLIGLYLVFKKYGVRGLITSAICIGLIILVADQTCQLFKHLLPRVRPAREPLLDGLVHIVNGYRGGPSGTVSAHAANSFGVLIFLSLLLRKGWFTFLSLLLCIVICYSRIYLGVHYPFDIMWGTILGLVVSQLFYLLSKPFIGIRRKQNYSYFIR